MSTVNCVRICKFEELSGYTEKAVRRKIEDGVWTQGVQYHRAPDGNIVIDIKGYEAWAAGRPQGESK